MLNVVLNVGQGMVLSQAMCARKSVQAIFLLASKDILIPCRDTQLQSGWQRQWVQTHRHLVFTPKFQLLCKDSDCWNAGCPCPKCYALARCSIGHDYWSFLLRTRQDFRCRAPHLRRYHVDHLHVFLVAHPPLPSHTSTFAKGILCCSVHHVINLVFCIT